VSQSGCNTSKKQKRAANFQRIASIVEKETNRKQGGRKRRRIIPFDGAKVLMDWNKK